ncbi:MAG: hypothetical protein JWR69_2141 [Pedosphaera sp.]|nr:hypothetical protein [Pedosphaera sp.]
MLGATTPIWFRGDDLFVGGLLMAAGIYAWSYIHFHPGKLSPKMTFKQFRWLCIGMIVCGAFVGFSRLIFGE